MDPISQRHRILFVEDDAIHARVLSAWFEAAGVDVMVAISVAEAKALLRQRWDLVLSDVELPDGNGLQVARFAKAEYPTMPVVLITATQTPETVAECARLGVEELMLKLAPLKREYLTHRIKELIAQSLRSAA